MLVKFIAVDNKKQIDDNYAYINDIYKAIRAGGLIKNLNIAPDAAAFGVGAVLEGGCNLGKYNYNNYVN